MYWCYTFFMNLSPEEAFHKLSYYTLSLYDPEFIHQYAVDAFATQTAHKNTKPITIAFALIGLYLHIEKNYSGKMVQMAHMQLAKYKSKLPPFVLPQNRGKITVFDVLTMPEGDARNAKIEQWMQSVWKAYAESHKTVEEFLQTYLDMV
jgi:hypothetical protein